MSIDKNTELADNTLKDKNRLKSQQGDDKVGTDTI